MTQPLKEKAPVGWYSDRLGRHYLLALHGLHAHDHSLQAVFKSERSKHPSEFYVEKLEHFIDRMKVEGLVFVGTKAPRSLGKDSPLRTGALVNIKA